MGKFPQTLEEMRIEASDLERKFFRFCLSGTVFLILFFVVAFIVNPKSSEINLSSLALVALVLSTWIYWIVLKVWVVYYALKSKRN